MSSKKPYKFGIEAGVNIYVNFYQLCQQDEFKILEGPDYIDNIKHYNIYFICQRSRVEIDPEYIVVNEETVHYRFFVYENGEKYVVDCAMQNMFDTTELSIKSKPPYNYFHILNNKQEEVFSGKSAYILDLRKKAMNFRMEFLDLEILYIGRTTKVSKKPVIDRLISHSKLQEIYFDTIHNSPDKEIYLVLINLAQDGTIEGRGTIETQEEYRDEDIRRFKEFANSKMQLTPSQTTILAEAALIKYFQPKYNVEFKDSFPTKKHSSYKHCYELDLSAVSIEINTDLHLFSSHVPVNNKHFQSYHLPTEADRRKFLDFENDPPIFKEPKPR